jgi:transcriptional regulator with XRE-family HTH domain
MNLEKKHLKEIGQRIFDIRKKLGLNQLDLAKELHVSNGTISELEAGNGKPSYDVLYNLSKKHNIDVHWILHGTGEMYKVSLDALIIDSISPGERIPLMEKFIRYFKGSELVRFNILAYFKEVYMKNESLIEREMSEGNARKNGNKDDV